MAQRHVTSRLLRPLAPNGPLKGSFTPPPRRSMTKRPSVLSRSTLFLQEGVSINELPILIRRLDKSLIPVSTNKLSLDDIQKMSQQDEIFRMKLQDCVSAKQVFKLLEIPSEQVTAYTAAFALDRLCQLQKARNNDLESIHSFIRDAVLKELCDTLERGVGTLISGTLITMLKCSLKNSFPEQTQEVLLLETEKRLSDGRLTVLQLCELCQIAVEESLNEFLDHIHIHISHRKEEIDSKNLVKVYEALSKKVTPSTRTTLATIESVIMNSWWQLTNDDTAKVLTSLVHLNYKSIGILTVFGKLLFLNIQNFEDAQLKRVIYAYIHFNFNNKYLFKALGKFATAKTDLMSTKVTALIMEYCRSCRHLSVPIFDVVADHVKKHGHNYSADELYLILRPFGQLNYLPTKAGPVFVQVEKFLSDKYDDFLPEKIIELLTSFAYIERFPINFVRRIFTPFTFSVVNNIPEPGVRDAACRDLMKLQSAVKTEWRDCRVPYLFSYDASKDKFLDQIDYRILCDMKEELVSLLPGHYVYQSVSLERSPYILDFLVERREKNVMCLLPDARVAIVVTTARDFTVNTLTPLGDLAMKLRHIRLNKLGLVQIPQSGYCRSGDKLAYLKKQIDKYVSLRST